MAITKIPVKKIKDPNRKAKEKALKELKKYIISTHSSESALKLLLSERTCKSK